MASRSVQVRVPATVGNFGGALNCAALALEASLNVKVVPRLDGRVGIRYFGDNGERVPRDRSNLVVRALEAALHLKGLEFTGGDFEIYSSVPVAVGLGSSTAAVLGGLIAADQLFRLQLDEKTYFDLAGIYESRGDNLRAAWFGGFVACAEEGRTPSYRRTVVPENLILSVAIPETRLSPSERKPAADPKAGQDLSLHFRRAEIFAKFFAEPGNGHATGLEAPLPPTCEKALPGMVEALKVQRPGLLTAFVCGSGPAIGLLAQGDSTEDVRAVRESFARHGIATCVGEFRPTNSGAREWNALHPEMSVSPSKRPGARAQSPKITAV